MHENHVWNGRPSQWLNAWRYLIGGILLLLLLIAELQLNGTARIWLTIPLALIILRMLWVYLVVRCTGYTLTDQRLKMSYGVFSRRFDEVELYRVKDAVMEQPFLLRLVGLSHITIVGFDAIDPIVHLQAVRDGKQLRESFRNIVESRRDAKSVRVSEMG